MEIYKITPIISRIICSAWCFKIFSSENSIKDTQEIFHIGKNDSDEILWSDIPNVSNGQNSKENISKIIRFSFIYNWIYGPALTGTWSKIKKFQNENWFKRLIFKNTYNSDSKSCEIGHEHNQEIISLMKEYSQDVLTWVSDMQYSTVSNTDQKMNLILADFFSEYNPKEQSKRVGLKDKLNSSEKDQFSKLISDSKNIKLLNIMSNICYTSKYREQKGLSVFMDILFRACEN